MDDYLTKSSFRCSFHRNVGNLSKRSSYSTSYNWELAKNLAKANSLKSLLLIIIKPSSHDLQRRRNFQPKPSRFFWMNNNPDGVAVS
uniref:Uncharacterized protein LOC104221523 n=1 Tax=Nicotiana sylvestris TaxID=4096 RepID=A0A1U7W9H4_NICSY|nr:PREDICTED: uncharacterized protein LOC104221523 [Nicotiana sylvestris]